MLIYDTASPPNFVTYYVSYAMKGCLLDCWQTPMMLKFSHDPKADNLFGLFKVFVVGQHNLNEIGSFNNVCLSDLHGSNP